MLRKLLCALALFLIAENFSFAGTLIPPDSTWRYFKGLSEASSPDSSAWRTWDFDDSSWSVGQAAFYYEDQPTSANAFTGNTVLRDMNGGYTCIFLRRSFVVTNLYAFDGMQVAGFSDDGFLAWLNGNLVASFNMPTNEAPYNGVSRPALPEPISWWTNDIPNFRSYLRLGTNVLAVQAFNSSLSGSSDFTINPAFYFSGDTTAPVLSMVYPQAGDVVRELTSVEVAFSEPVTGVDAADLLINGQPATGLTVVSPDQFVFTFAQPSTGSVQVSWAAAHGITDLGGAANPFGGGSWSYTLDPNAPYSGVMISEFLSANSGDLPNSLHDELGKSPDWVELYNAGNKAVNLQGWSLTDDASAPTKWVFPGVSLPAKGFLVVFASGRDTNVNGTLHTNFKLSSNPGFLGLYNPGGVLISGFAPTYPAQQTDVSYGRDLLDASLTGYYTNATPGVANDIQGDGFGPEVTFSRVGGTFLTDFSLALSCADANWDIRYVLVTNNVPYGSAAPTNIPTELSPVYTGPITITNAVVVRARTFPRQASYWPGPPRTECYVRISSTAASFASDLPVILLHTLGGGAVPQTTDQTAIAMVFEPVNGRTSLTNPPSLVLRVGLNIRGSSTAGLPQSSFALEFWDEYNRDTSKELLGMPAESDWVLFGQNSFDLSYLHNPLPHQLSRDLGRYSSRTRFAEVFLNTAGGIVTYGFPGNYFGLYTIEEKIKRDQQRVDLEELAVQNTQAPDVTGGYLLKLDREDPNERSFYDSAAQRSIIFQDPPGLEMVTAARQSQYNYITSYFSQFGTALWGVNYTNPVTGYNAWIDVESWIDHHILNVLPFNVDSMRLSGYFFKNRNRKLEMGPLWDFDRSLGSTDDRCFNPRLWRVQAGGDQGTDFFGNPSLLGVRWWQRLFTDRDFWQRYIDRWTDLRQGVLSTNHIFAVIDGFTNQLRQAQSRQVQRWGYPPRTGTISMNGYTYMFSGTYAGEIAFLKKWLSDRTEFIDTNFLKAPMFSTAGGPIAPGFKLTITAPTIESNTTTYYTLNGADPRLPGGAIAPYAIARTAPFTLTLNTNARIFARNYNLGHSNMTGGTVGGNPPISSPWSGATLGTFVTATPPLAITEIMYHPLGSGTNDPGALEYIELKNAGTQVLNLVGVRFTNGIDFTFTTTNAVTSLAPGKYVVIVKNRTLFSARYPAVTNVAGEFSGSLDNAGETIALQGALGEPILNFRYENSWYPTTDGLGFSLVIRNEGAAFDTWANAASWRPSSAINGSPGAADPAPTEIAPVVINEVLTHTDPPQVDTIELYNPTSYPVPVSGWFLSDSANQPRKYCIRDTTIPAQGYALFTEDQFNAGGTNSFALSSLGDEVYLFSGNGTNLTGYRHGFAFGAQVNGVTFGRYVTSDGVEHYVTQTANSLGSANPGPRIGPILISEILYSTSFADPLDEFVELRNISGQAVPLFDSAHPENTWGFDGGIQYSFPAGVVIPAGSFLLVLNFDPVHDPVRLSWFRSRYNVPVNVPCYGPFDGKLANEGDRVGLYFRDKPEVAPSPLAGWAPYVLAEEVRYSNLPPWPTTADGTGNSLNRLSIYAFGGEPANWGAELPSPGRANPVAATLDTDQDGLPDEWELAHGLDPTSASGVNGAAGDPDGDSVSNWQEYVAGTDPMNPTDFLRFDSVTMDAGYCSFRFNRQAGRVYTIERTEGSDPSGPWTLAIGNISGSGAYTFLVQPSPEPCFYRLKAAFSP